jgi:glycerol-3-phosphate dehydrogenase
MEFSHETRRDNIERMKRNPFDMIVIGGGITGAGVAREAALRGLAVALLEKGDFASGTSSKSARMVHGGFRYLEQLQIGLVISACSERYRLHKLAPRLVRPTGFIFPVYRHARNSLAKINLGLWLYEILALFRSIRRHRLLRPKEVRAREPAIQQQNLAGAIYYYDCLTDDARLTLATIKNAHALGAVVANYLEVTRILIEGGRVTGVEVWDVLSGETFAVRASLVANAAGVWVDRIRFMEDPQATSCMRANRGSHVILPRDKIPINDVVIFTSTDGKRGMYAVPWGNTVVVGTTDLDHEGSLDQVYATYDEVQEMVAAANRVFPGARITLADVIATYAGLRPLLDREGKDAYQASRDHEIFVGPSGLVSIAGGKLTTYRKMAEDMVDHIVGKLGREGRVTGVQKSISKSFPIEDPDYDLENVRSTLAERYPHTDRDIHDHLSITYGPGAEEILSVTEQDPELSQRLVPRHSYIYAEIPYAIGHEMAMTLDDFLIRRTHIIYETPDQGMDVARPVAGIMARYLNWDESEIERQMDAYRQQVELTKAFIRQEHPGKVPA